MIHYSESFVRFLSESDCKVAKLLYRAHIDHYRAYSLFVSNKQIDYITFRNDGTVSFLPAGKPHLTNEDGVWKRDGRQQGKPGKVIMKLFTANALKILNSKDFECFTNQYKAEYNGDDYTFKLEPNKSIGRVYSMPRINAGVLGDSCMNGDSEYMDIYTHCKHLSILTLLDKDEKLCGRALVWKVSDDLTIMDRIYVCKEFMYDMFIDYADKQDWYHKSITKHTIIKPNLFRLTGWKLRRN